MKMEQKEIYESKEDIHTLRAEIQKAERTIFLLKQNKAKSIKKHAEMMDLSDEILSEIQECSKLQFESGIGLPQQSISKMKRVSTFIHSGIVDKAASLQCEIFDDIIEQETLKLEEMKGRLTLKYNN